MRPLIFWETNISSYIILKAYMFYMCWEQLMGVIVPLLHLLGIQPYYCRKGFYSTLLEGVVHAQCEFWDYEFGWVGHIHDWILFQSTKFRKKTMRGVFLPNEFIGYAVHPMRPWFYSSFNSGKERLSHENTNWNFI